MSVDHAWVGATTPTSARVVSKISGSAARLLVADNPSMSGAVASPEVTASPDSIVSLPISGLNPDTQYWWQIEVDSTLDTTTTGRFRTHPTFGEPADFSFAVGNCAAGATVPGIGTVLANNRLSNHPVFADIINRDPLFHAHLGDLHYYDLGSGNHGITGGASIANYRTAYDDVLAQPNQHELYRNVALMLTWDDHDRGPNDNDRTFSGAEVASQVYRERVPHYPLPHADGVQQAVQVGRVLFIMDDVRTFRDPNGDANVPGKSLLGSAQLSWMEQLLTTTDAEFFVWLSAERAFHVNDVESPSSGTDSWGAFTYERADVVQLFGDTGWLPRMLILNGDFHHMGMNDGSHPYGGMPIYQFATYDSSSTDPDAPPPRPDLWNAGSKSGSGRYGTVHIEDTGSRITVTGTGWLRNTPQLTHTFSVNVGSPTPPPPSPSPPGVAQATIQTRVTWLSCDAASGRVLATLPEIKGNVSRIIGAPKASGLTLPIPRSGPGALPISLIDQIVVEGRTMIVAVVNDIPTWGGLIIGPTESGTDAEIRLPCATLEAYLDRRVVRNHNWVNQDASSVIAAGLIADAEDISGLGQGLNLVVDAEPIGLPLTRSYLLSDRRTVLSALDELSTVAGGPEWTIDLDWLNDSFNVIQKIFRVRQRIGRAASNGSIAMFQTNAESVFGSQTSSEAKYRYRRDYGDGRGANYVVAYSSGEGEDQPASQPAIATDILASGFPIYEQHYQPESDILDTSILDAHAQAELERRRNGVEEFQLEARWDAYPRYGVHWQIGDDIAWELIGHRHPGGIRGSGRVIGFTLDMQRQIIIPTLRETE